MRLTDFVVLLVEDDPDQVFLVQRALDKAKLVNPVRSVRDGEEAIAYLSGAAPYHDRDRYPLPSLVLLDLRLPRLSGLRVLEWMRGNEQTRRLPVIVLTSSDDEADMNRACALGVNAYLRKPVRSESLIEAVTSAGMFWVILHPGPTPTPAGGLETVALARTARV